LGGCENWQMKEMADALRFFAAFFYEGKDSVAIKRDTHYTVFHLLQEMHEINS
jgi:hypothetical protein